ncbi:MAG: endonuclease/exonuclease/phosphatase family protein [Burkholderiaceae bacterium]|jgi:endonuclease/exonuclease/phosphatase family metal-dependent hydrolase|nr:endonuclease/exonuclease/phosphatase family protein [Burkholderiaceae bacterium]
MNHASHAIRIATLNCLNLALPARRTYEGWAPYSADEYLAKTQWLAQLLDRLAADVVLVQEVFHEKALGDVVRQTVSQGRGWSFAAPLADENNALPRLGLLWRAPWQPQITSIAELPDGCAVPLPDMPAHARFSRPVLLARLPLPPTLAADGRPAELALLNVHLKSRRPEYAPGEDRDDLRCEARAQLRSLIMRGAEAAAVRQLVVDRTRHNRTPLIVAGDFNDEPNAVTTQIVADTSWKREDRGQRDCMLFNALDVEQRLVPARGRDVAFTIVHAGEPERIDHVLVSEEFVPHSRHAVGYVERVEVLNDHLVERRRGRAPLAAAAGQDGPDLGRILSDHAAVCVSIVLGKSLPR